MPPKRRNLEGGFTLGLFGKKKSPLPADIVQRMERLGRHEYDPMNSPDDASEVFQYCLSPLLEIARTQPDLFVTSLADACIPVGGWAVYGAQSAVADLVGLDPRGVDGGRLLDAAIEFLREHYVPPVRVPTYMWHRFLDNGGDNSTWLTLRPPPDRSQVKLTPPEPGETRLILRMGIEPSANTVLIRMNGNEIEALIERSHSTEDLTRSQEVWKTSSSQYDLYLDIAYAIQARVWADPELEPFYPTPQALI